MKHNGFDHIATREYLINSIKDSLNRLCVNHYGLDETDVSSILVKMSLETEKRIQAKSKQICTCNAQPTSL